MHLLSLGPAAGAASRYEGVHGDLAATHTQRTLCGAVSEWRGSDRPFDVTAPQTRSVLAGKRGYRMSTGSMPTGGGPCPSCPISIAPRCGGGAWGRPPRMGLAPR